MPPKRWIIFAAVSSKPQADEDKDSIPSQLRDARAYVSSQGGTVIDELVISGFSRDFYTWAEFAKAAKDSKDKIDAPTRMIRHWEACDFDGLWIREPSRIGRKMGLVNEVIGRTVDTGAVIYVAMTGQTLTRRDAAVSSMIGGYTAEMELKTLVERRRMGIAKRVERGLPIAEVPVTHTLIRDDKGKSVRLDVNPQAREFFTRVARLLVAGESYREIERLLNREGITLPGVKIDHNKIRILIYKPLFWGHNAQNWRGQDGPNRQRTGLWILEPGHPAPEGVRIVYNTHESVLIGGIAEQLKQELRRRSETVQGKAKPLSITAFTGLIVCDECYCAVSRGYTAKTPGGDTYRCTIHNSPRYGLTCSQSKTISEADLKAYINAVLLEPFARRDYSVLVPTDTTLQDHLIVAQQALTQEEERLARLIDGQSRAKASVFEHYARQIDEVSEYIERMQRTVDDLSSQMANAEARYTTLDHLAATAPAPLTVKLWELPRHEIHQFLFALLGPLQLVMREGEIMSLAPRRQGRGKRLPKQPPSE